MENHLPECEEFLIDGGGDCICHLIRVCEQRVREETLYLFKKIQLDTADTFDYFDEIKQYRKEVFINSLAAINDLRDN